MSIISIPRISDNYLIKVFVDDVLKNHEEHGITPTAQIVIGLPGLSVALSIDAEGGIQSNYDSIVETLRDATSSSILNITFHDKSKHPHCRLVYKRSPDSFIDSLDFSKEAKSEEVVLIQQKIHAMLLRCINGNSTADIRGDVFSAHHEVLTKLEGFNANLIADQHEHSQKVEGEKHSFLEANGEKHQARMAELEDDFKSKRDQLDSEYQEKDDALKAREQAVEDADNTTARRKTTTSMLEKVQEKAERFNFSSSVNRRSAVTVILCLVLMILGGMNSYYALQGIDNLNYTTTSEDGFLKQVLRPTAEKPTEMLWFLYVRVFFGSVLFITSTLYLIKWMNSWTNRIAQQELENQKFVRDLNRSHLTIEMCLEWNEKKDGTIPEQLLAAMTEGLFKDKVQANTEVNHPIDQLASALVKSAEKIEFPLGNGKITTSGKAVAKEKTPKQDIPKDGQAA